MALLPVVAILAGIAVALGSGSGARLNGATFTPIGRPGASGQASRIPPGPGALVAQIVHATTMRAAPGGRRLAGLHPLTEFGSPDVLWVITHSPGWLGVLSPKAGNGHIGWIPQADAVLRRDRFQLQVSLSARRLTVLDGSSVLQRYTIAIGQPNAPTPTGRFAVTDRLVTGNPAGPYGCCVLALSALAPHAIGGWQGGNRIAIHSTPDEASIGEPVSHGCMRLTLAEGQWLVDHVPLGTPTVIRS